MEEKFYFDEESLGKNSSLSANRKAIQFSRRKLGGE